MKDVGSSWKLCLIGIVGYFKPTDTIKCLVDICMTNQTLLWIPALCIMFWGIIYSPAATEMLSYRNMFPLNPVFIISDYPVFRLEWNKSEMCCWFSLESALCRCRMLALMKMHVFHSSSMYIFYVFCHFLYVWLEEKKDISHKQWEQWPDYSSASVEEKLPGLSSAVTSSRGVMASPRWWFLDNLSVRGWGQKATSAFRML